MKIDASFKAELVQVKASTDSDSGTKTITPVIAFKVTEDEAKKILGEEFHKLAFSAFSSFEGEPVPLFKSIRSALGVEKHTVKMLGHGPFPVIPILTGIKAVKGERVVIATIELPLVFESKPFGGELLDKLGEIIDLTMKATQLDLPGVQLPGVVRNSAGPFGNGPRVAI